MTPWLRKRSSSSDYLNMSLLRLLTVGRSLGLIRDRPSRYKMTQQSLLPKFGPAKADETGVLERDANLKVADGSPAGNESPTAAIDANAAKRKKTMTTIETEFPATPKQAYPAGRWTIFRNPFGSAVAKPQPAVQGKNPVQGELLLDAVKPVCNDLSDSDLEVVRTERAKPVATAPPAVPVLSLSSQTNWDRVTTQFFGAGKP